MKIGEPVVVEERFNAPVERVWQAITEVDEMKKWFFENIPSFKTEVGFETQFNVENDGRDFLHLWRVVDAVPMKRIALNWKYSGYAGDSVVTFELSVESDSTRLQLKHEATENFPGDIPEFTRESCARGWEYFIKDRLAQFLSQE